LPGEQVTVPSTALVPSPGCRKDLPVGGHSVPVALDPAAQPGPRVRQGRPGQPYLIAADVQEVAEDPKHSLCFGELAQAGPPDGQLSVLVHRHQPQEHLRRLLAIGRGEQAVGLLGERAEAGVVRLSREV
jgi:hypothetical protein